MAKRWLHSLDVEIDENGQAVAEKALQEIESAMAVQEFAGGDSVEVAAAGFTDVLEVVLEGKRDILTFQVAATENGTDGFKVLVKSHASADYIDYLSDADFNSLVLANMLFASTTGPHELSAGGKALVVINVRGAYAVKFQASATADDAHVAIKGTAGRA